MARVYNKCHTNKCLYKNYTLQTIITSIMHFSCIPARNISFLYGSRTKANNHFFLGNDNDIV